MDGSNGPEWTVMKLLGPAKVYGHLTIPLCVLWPKCTSALSLTPYELKPYFHHYPNSKICAPLSLIHGFLGPSSSVIPEKNPKLSPVTSDWSPVTGDFTAGSYKLKIIYADRVSVELSFDANFKWHMPICG